MYLYGPLSGLFAIFALVVLVLKIYVVVDVVRRRDEVFRAASSNKTFWLVVAIVGLLLTFSGFGILGIASLVATLVYMLDVRRRLDEVSGGRRRWAGPR